MIDDSYSWKLELRREWRSSTRRISLALRADPEMETDRLLVTLERMMFVSAFIIRKLLEARKLSDEMEAETFPVTVYPRVNGAAPHDAMNVHRPERFYDFGSASSKTITLKFLSDQLIHSFVFAPIVDPASGKLIGVLFNSDRSKLQAVYQLELETMKSVVDAVCNDAIVSISRFRPTGEVRKSRTKVEPFEMTEERQRALTEYCERNDIPRAESVNDAAQPNE